MKIFKNMKSWIVLLGFAPIIVMGLLLYGMSLERLLIFNGRPEHLVMLFMMPALLVLFALNLLSDQDFVKRGKKPKQGIGLSEIDIAFLKDLQHEMLTQDTVCQAAPRFWVVRGTVKEYGIEGDWADDSCIRVDFETTIESMEDAYEYLLEHHSSTPYKYNDNETIEYYDGDYWRDLNDFDDVCDFLQDKGEDEAEVIGCRNVEKNFENTFFLTNSECKAHIKSNYYHYPSDAHSYCMTAWRAPQVSRLWDILDKINWESVEELTDEGF